MKTAGLILLIAVMFVPVGQLKELKRFWLRLRLPGKGAWCRGDDVWRSSWRVCRPCSIQLRFRLVIGRNKVLIWEGARHCGTSSREGVEEGLSTHQSTRWAT